MRNNRKNGWALFLLILAGIVVGGFLGTLFTNVPALSWLNYGYSFGMLGEPFTLDLRVIVLTFKLVFNITMSSIVGVLIGVLVYKLL